MSSGKRKKMRCATDDRKSDIQCLISCMTMTKEKLIPQNSIERLRSINMLLHMHLHVTLSTLIFQEIAPLFPCLLIVHRAWGTFCSNLSLVNCHLRINCSFISLSLDSTLWIFSFSRLLQLDAIIQNYI